MVCSGLLGITTLGIFLLLVGIIKFISCWILFASSDFAVTDRRIILKTGALTTRSVEILLRKVEVLGVNRGFLGSVFDYGSIVVGGTGGTKETFKGIAKPFAFRKEIQSAITV